MDVAREIMDRVAASGVDAHIEDRTDYNRSPIETEWVVMVDATQHTMARGVLDLYLDEQNSESVVDTEQEYPLDITELEEHEAPDLDSPDADFDSSDADFEDSSADAEILDSANPIYKYNVDTQRFNRVPNKDSDSGSSFGCGGVFMILCVLAVINYIIKCNRSSSSYNPPLIEHFSINDRAIQSISNSKNKISPFVVPQQDEKRRIAELAKLVGVEYQVQEKNKLTPLRTADGNIIKHVTLDGRVIKYDIDISKSIADDDVSDKAFKRMATKSLRSILLVENDYYDISMLKELADLGITFRFNCYRSGDRHGATTITLTAKQLHKRSKSH